MKIIPQREDLTDAEHEVLVDFLSSPEWHVMKKFIVNRRAMHIEDMLVNRAGGDLGRCIMERYMELEGLVIELEGMLPKDEPQPRGEQQPTRMADLSPR